MYKVTVLTLLTLLSFFHSSNGNDDLKPVELNDDNFEHLTQAATGQTTGKWLVNFMSPGCGHCSRLKPAWEDLAHELGTEHKDLGIINANVNLVDNHEVRTRFGINSFPTIIYFADRKMYKYDGGRSVDDFVEFATNSYKTKEAETVPPPPAAWQEAMKVLRKKVANHKIMSDMLFDFDHILEVRKNAAVLLFVCGFILGCLVTFMLTLMGGQKVQKVKIS